MEQSILSFCVGLIGIEEPDRSDLERMLQNISISTRDLNETDISILRERSVIDRNLIGIVASDKYLYSINNLLHEERSDFLVLKYDDGAASKLQPVVEAIARWLGARAISLAHNLAAVSIELSELRGMFDGLQRSHVELDRYLSRNALNRPQTLFFTQAGQSVVILPSAGAVVHQPLPHDPYGLCAVGLRLSSTMTGRTGLDVELLLGRDCVHHWSVRGPLQRGRLLLSLPAALREEYRAPSLIITAHTDNRDPVELVLAEQRAALDWSAKLDGLDLEFPLALELEFAPPGTTVTPRIGSGRLPATEEVNDSKVLLLDSWSNIDYQAEPLQHDWQVVVAEDGTLQAHPLQNAMTVVHLSNLEFDGVRRLRADIRLAHEQAPRVGFALALVPKDKRRRVNVKDPKLNWAARKTSWFELTGKAEGHAIMELGPTDAEGMSLALVTACLDKRAEFAWARWGSIVLER